ncbi:MAG: hypothetical protein KAG95_07185, partial [Bacteroidales bacterium]|nr:hypothetical protein [Bacteroidales bacterium]
MKYSFSIWLYSILLLATTFNCLKAQDNNNYILKFNTSDGNFWEAKNKTKSFKNDTLLLHFINNKLLKYINQGYTNASIDTIEISDKLIYISFHKKHKFYLTSINYFYFNNPKKQIEHPFPSFKTKAFSPDIIYSLQEKTVRQFENSGHPFASIITDTIQTKGNNIHINYIINKGPYYIFDSLDFLKNIR